jgi:hypothetical protein
VVGRSQGSLRPRSGGRAVASLRWRKMRVMTDSWVMAAMMRSAPRWQYGHVGRCHNDVTAMPQAIAMATRDITAGIGIANLYFFRHSGMINSVMPSALSDHYGPA